MMRFGWVTINVKNMGASLSFYQDVIGFQVHRRMNSAPGTEIIFLGFGGKETEVELIRNEKNNAPSYGKDISLGFEVDSLDSQIDLLKNKGLPIAGPFQPNPTIRFIYVDDPNGVKIQFFQNVHS